MKSFLLLIFCLFSIAMAAPIEKVRFIGLDQVSENDAKEWLTIHIGDDPTSRDLSNQVKSLYQSGLFKSVKINQQNGTLNITVVENPIINTFKLSGNIAITDKEMAPILKQNKLTPGYVFSKSRVAQFQRALEFEYQQKGYLNVKTSQDITRNGNKVSVVINVDEGSIARYNRIVIEGNDHFMTLRLRYVMNIATTNPISYFTEADVYSERNLSTSLDELIRFYKNHGYPGIEIVEKKIEISEDKKHVDLKLRIYEGPRYYLGKFIVHSSVKPPKMVERRMHNLEGMYYSEAKVSEVLNAYQQYLLAEGYAFATFDTKLDINKEKREVNFILDVNPGKVYTIRHIQLRGNNTTQTHFLKNYVDQFEGQKFSQKDLESSQRKLMSLGYLDTVQYTIQPVPTYNDKVDVIYNVKEKENVNSIMFQAGYGGGQGVIIGTNLNFKNFLGTGKQVSFTAERNKTTNSVSLTHFDPFFLDKGITQSTKLYFTKVNSDRIKATDYKSENIGAGLTYGFPVTAGESINLGFNYEHSQLRQSGDQSDEVQNFFNRHGDNFDTTSLNFGVNSNQYISNMFIKQNARLEVGFPLFKHNLNYYTISYSARIKQQLFLTKEDQEYALEMLPRVSYGQGYGEFDGDLPFFKRFYVGGFGSVRNFRAFSIGPKDSIGNSAGGNLMSAVQFNLFFPAPFSSSLPIKTALFFDTGSVYENNFSTDELRMSAGLMASLKVASLPIALSFGKNISKKPGDSFKPIDFAIGMDF